MAWWKIIHGATKFNSSQWQEYLDAKTINVGGVDALLEKAARLL